MRKDFSSILYNPAVSNNDEKIASSTFTTAEQIDVKNSYSANDLKDAEHLHFAAGIPPFLRGPYSSMYVQNPWTIRQYAGFSTAEESNAFYRRNLAGGQKGLSAARSIDLLRAFDGEVLDQVIEPTKHRIVQGVRF